MPEAKNGLHMLPFLPSRSTLISPQQRCETLRQYLNFCSGRSKGLRASDGTKNCGERPAGRTVVLEVPD